MNPNIAAVRCKPCSLDTVLSYDDRVLSLFQDILTGGHNTEVEDEHAHEAISIIEVATMSLVGNADCTLNSKVILWHCKTPDLSLSLSSLRSCNPS